MADSDHPLIKQIGQFRPTESSVPPELWWISLDAPDGKQWRARCTKELAEAILAENGDSFLRSPVTDDA